MSTNQTPRRIGNFRTFPVARSIDARVGTTDNAILQFVGSGKRVLELGCATGHMSAALGEQDCSVVGIEIHPEAAQQAAAFCERVIVGDLDYLDFNRELQDEVFDVVLAADVLEHLKDPLSVLQSVRQFLRPGGHIVISVPNVAHLSVRLALLSGQFPYSKSGLLDQTHLRFLTRDSLEKLMDDADLAIGRIERITNIPEDPSQFEVPYRPNDIPSAMLDEISRDPEAWTYQFVISAFPLPSSGLAFIQDRMKSLAHETARLHGEADQLRLDAQQAHEAGAISRAELEEAHQEIAALRATAQSLDECSAAFVAARTVMEERCAALMEDQELLRKETERIREAHTVQIEKQANEHEREKAGLRAQIQTLTNREKDLREMLLDAHEQLLRRDDEIAVTLASSLPQFPSHVNTPAPAASQAVPLAAAVPKPASAGGHSVNAPAPGQKPFGVNLAGNLTSEKGVGEAARGQGRSLSAAGVPVVVNNFRDDTSVNNANGNAIFSNDNPYAVNLIHLNADTLPQFVESRPKDYFQGRYNIGFWAWETSTFPERWHDRFRYLSEIWVGSNFVLDSLSRVSPVPVIKTPLSVSPGPWGNRDARSRLGVRDKTCVFLFVFDYMSVIQRKNPMGLIQAFRKAFHAKDDVLLVMKSAHSEAYPMEARMLQQACNGVNARIIDGVTSRAELNALMGAADCYVSLHRSEGFGLTMAEAMQMGKPVIATAYSGNTEFMTAGNSYLVKYKLIEIDRPCGPYESGEWADPDLNHAAQLMRHIFNNREEASQVGQRARAHILENLAPAVSGAIMRERLNRLAELGRISGPDPDDRPAQNSESDIYRYLVKRIQGAVEAHTPIGSRVLVVSRGDDNLLRLDGRDGRHFPQDSEGSYAGHHPADDAEAIERLQSLVDQGAEYLVFPQTAFWWLDHYSGLRSRLDSHSRRVWRDPDSVIYALSQKARPRHSTQPRKARRKSA